MTGAELIADVLRIMSVLGDTDAISAEQAANHTQTLNEIMSEWEADGLELGFTPLLSPTDNVTLPDWSVRAVKYAMAEALGPEYGEEPDPRIMELARRSRAVVSKMTSENPVVQLDDIPMGRRSTQFNINTGS